jgi:hypothetical protein
MATMSVLLLRGRLSILRCSRRKTRRRHRRHEEAHMNRVPQKLGIAIASMWVALSGCAQPTVRPGPPPGLAAAPCTPGVCTIRVFVERCNAADGIRLDKPLVEANSAVNMRWEIVTPGFEFDTQGIQFDPPNAQFEVQHSPKPNEFRVQNRKTQTGDFYYFVNVKGCVRHDPWVRNR